MVFVPAGPFTMGCTSADSAIESMETVPDHVVKTDAYFVDVHEVTNARYAKFLQGVAADGHKTCPEDEPGEKDHRPADWKEDLYAMRSPGDDYPVSGIGWDEARAYCAWLGKRLPTEAEWEKAARGTDAAATPGGTSRPRRRVGPWALPRRSPTGRIPRTGTATRTATTSARPWGVSARRLALRLPGHCRERLGVDREQLLPLPRLLREPEGRVPGKRAGPRRRSTAAARSRSRPRTSSALTATG